MVSVVEHRDGPQIFANEMEKVKRAKRSRQILKTRRRIGKTGPCSIELIRKLMEKQAMRRVEAGSLTDEEIGGETLMK
jgi:hypothetical protein